MSRETMSTLNTLQLIGNVDELGKAWHFDELYQGTESNHYAGFIPPEDVRCRLLNWTAEEAPVQYLRPEIINEDGVTPAEMVTDETRKVIYRSDTGHVMGVFSASYARHQHDNLLDSVMGIVGDGLGISSAGLLEDGAVAYVQVQRADSIVLADGAEYRPFLLAMGSHNGKRATGFQWVVTRVVCDNTLAWAASEKGAKYKIKHTRYSQVKIKDAREALGIIDTGTGGFAEEMDEFLAMKVSDKQWSDFLDNFVPLDDDMTKRSQTMAENKRGMLNQLYKHDDRVAPWVGTGWGVYNAVNTYDQHHAIARGLGDGNEHLARKGRSLMAVSGGDLDKQVAEVRKALTPVL